MFVLFVAAAAGAVFALTPLRAAVETPTEIPAAATEPAAPGQPAGTETTPAPAVPAVPADNDVLSVLRILQESDLLNLEDVQVRTAVIRAIVEAARCGAVFVPSDGTAPEGLALSAEPPGIRGPLAIGSSMLYVQAFNIDHVQIEEFSGRLKDHGATPTGIVVDLRAATGAATETMAVIDRELSGLAVPMVLLIGQHTEGAGELLARRLRERPHVVAMGEPTSGRFPHHRRRELASGAALLIPEALPPELRSLWPPTALAPDIAMEQEISADAFRLLTEDADVPTRLGRDPLLRRAVDLLAIVTGLQPAAAK